MAGGLRRISAAHLFRQLRQRDHLLRDIRLLGTNKVAAVSTAITAAALLGFSFSENLPAMCLCAVPLGLGAGAIDTALNNYVALHYSARVMSFLHCFFGIGVTISPFILSQVIGGKAGGAATESPLSSSWPSRRCWPAPCRCGERSIR